MPADPNFNTKQPLLLPRLFLPKQQFIGVLLVLVVGLLISLMLQISYWSMEPPVDETNRIRSYDEVITHQLRERIYQAAQKSNCKGYIAPVETISGDAPPRSLRNDLNIALLSYKGWNVLVDNATGEEIFRRHDELLKKYPTAYSPNEMERIAGTAKIKQKPDYRVKAEWILRRNQFLDARLTISVIQNSTALTVFSENVYLTDPATERAILEKTNKEKANWRRIEQLAIIGRYGTYSSLGVIILLSLLQFYSWQQRRWQTKQYKQYLLDNINKRIKYLQEGNFVAALELAERYLEYFPHDIDVASFKQVLLDFTDNNPRQMQLELIETKKLMARIEGVATDRRLSSELGSSSLETRKNAPETPRTYQHMLEKQSAAIANMQSTREALAVIEKISTLLSEGKLTAAKKALSVIRVSGTDSYGKIELLRKNLETLEDEAHKKFSKIEEIFRRGDVRLARNKLDEMAGDFPDYQPVEQLRKTLTEVASRKLTAFHLVPIHGDRALKVICKNRITLGREEPGLTVDIPLADRRISREHARITFHENQIFLEDLGSTNGTFLDGNPVRREPLHSGAVITLSKILDLKVILPKTEINESGLLLSGDGEDYLLVRGELSFELRGESINLEGTYRLRWSGEILLLTSPQTCTIFEPDREIQIGDLTYKIETIK